MSKLTTRLREEIGDFVSTESVRSIAMRLLENGQLERAQQPLGRREVWFWQRRRGLSPEVADLERRFREAA